MKIKFTGLPTLLLAISSGVLSVISFKKSDNEYNKLRRILYKISGVLLVLNTILSIKIFADKNLLPEELSSEEDEEVTE